MAYKSSYTGPQIDQAVSHAVNMDVNPTAGHTDRVVSSGGVKSALNTVDESIAIRVSGNKTSHASGAAIGQYVIVDGSTITGISDGLYKAAKAIPYNTVIDSTYLTAVSGGGLNDIKSALPQKATTTLTTNANGSAALPFYTNSTIVIAVTNPTNAYKCVPFVYDQQWFVSVYDTSGTAMSALASSSFSATIYYMSI